VLPSLTFLLRKLRSEVLENLGLNGCVLSVFVSMMIEEGLIVCGYALPESVHHADGGNVEAANPYLGRPRFFRSVGFFGNL
jgi:hypothetical protein